MGAGGGTNAISITNHSTDPITLTAVQDSSVAEGDRKKTYTIQPKDSHLFFTNKIESISWERSK